MASVPSGVIGIWAGTNASIPTGWTRVTDLDDRFIKGTATSTDPDVTGGSSTHTHTATTHTHSTIADHSHSVSLPYPGFASVIGGPVSSEIYASSGHTHGGSTSSTSTATGGGTGTANWNTPTELPSWFQVIFVESADAQGFADDLICYYDSGTDPTDWVQHAGSVGRFFRGMTTSGNGGGTGGGGSHTHSASGTHTHSGTTGNHEHDGGTSGAAITATVQGTSGSGTMDTDLASHTHVTNTDSSGSASITAGTGAASAGTTYEPSYHKLNAIQNTTGASIWIEDGIFMWLGLLNDIPPSWRLCDGTLSTPDLRDRFILNDASGGGDHGGTGGTDGHTHSDGSGHTHATASHTHTFTVVANTDGETDFNAGVRPISFYNHPHSGGTTGGATPATSSAVEPASSTSDTQPPFRTVAYIMSPAEPFDALFFGHAF